jgi:P4 family phage/plasmid primase-like protien
MNRTVSGDQDDHKLPHGHEGSDAQAGLPCSGDSQAWQRGNDRGGQADLLARWNTQAPHLTALEAFEQYGWSVFPLDQEKKPPQSGRMHPNGTPGRLSWYAYQTQRASKATLLAWARQYAPPAWAVITGGLSGLIVLDFDGSEGTRLLRQLGLAPHVRTGSGGYHIYFVHPGWPVKTLNGKSASELGQRWPGLDIRADGGYAAFCGHNARGRYEWLRAPLLESVEKLPKDLRRFLDLLHAPDPMSTTRHTPAETALQQRIPLKTRLLEKALQRVGMEGRNNAGFWLACQLRDTGVTEKEARLTMEEYTRRVPPINAKGQREAYTEREALASLKSAYQRAPLRDAIATPHPGRPTQEVHIPEADLELVLDCYRKDEWGDALLFAHLFEGQCVYDHTEKAWYLWQGHFWKRDEVGRVRQLISGQLASVYLKAAADLNARLGEQKTEAIMRMEEDEQQEQDEKRLLNKLIKGVTGRAFALRGLGRNTHVLAFACTDERLALTSDRWDNDPWLLGTADGVLDLRTGLLRDGIPDGYIRTIIPTSWQGSGGQAPRFERFLQEIFGDREHEERTALITFLQRALGYGITGSVAEHIFLLLYGEEGRNGKDTLMSVLHYVLGKTVGAVSNDVILSSGRKGTPGAAKPHLCSLQGKRIAWASETDKGARFDIGQVKFLTGGGTIPARQLYGKEYAFEPSHLLLLLTNNKPHADANDKAFWERLCPITFHLRFVDHPAGSLERRRDRELGTILQSEASGILAWLVRGCMDWQQCGLEIPPGVLLERAVYREEEDTLHHFFADCCVLAPEAKVKSAQLFDRYKQWAEDNNITRKMSGTAFGLEMKRTFQQQRNNQGTYYRGIGLLDHSSTRALQPLQQQKAGKL